MVSLLASGVVDPGLELQSGQTKDWIGIFFNEMMIKVRFELDQHA
jgi:hypothetical protein